MKKRDTDEEEIPLTHITDATRARFDSLLKAALNGGQQGQKKKGQKKRNRHVTSGSPQHRDVEEGISSDSRYSSPVHILRHEEERKKSPSGGYYNSMIGSDSDIDLNESAQNEELIHHTIEHIKQSTGSSPQFSGNRINVEADIERENVQEKTEQEEVPRRPKRPVPLPRIKTGKRNKDQPNSETRQVLKDEERRQTKQEAEEEITVVTEEPETVKPSPVKQKIKTPVKKSHAKVKAAEFTYEKIIGVFIHRSDHLTADALVTHPLVKVHLVNADTGEYLKKSDPNRSVSFFYESKETDYIQPLMTDVFDFQARKSFIPAWEELLIFNEDMQYLLRNDPKVLIMFEILDFVSSSVASLQYKKLGSEGGWHKVAWAFLKPVGASGHLNVEKKVRLQLYKHHHSNKSDHFGCSVYSYWIKRPLTRYPGTLYVTITGISPPLDLPPVLRSRMALQEEFTADLCGDPNDSNKNQEEEMLTDHTGDSSSKATAFPSITPVSWSRLPAQSCKIPNQLLLSLRTPSRGCMGVRFSHSGYLLACSMVKKQDYPIVIYTIPDGAAYVWFETHQGLVYDLHWSSCDTLLVSASADCTACVWDVTKRKTKCLQTLPHPSHVYCAAFHPAHSSLIATGCWDEVVRLWCRGRKASRYELVQELEGHSGFVSALCFNKFGELFSGDSRGMILIWNCIEAKKHFSPWKLQKRVALRDLQETVINRLVTHPGGQRLLVHSRDNLLRMVDLGTGTSIQWYRGALNDKVPTSACISPCGGLVFAASEDGTVFVWDVDTGEQLAVYNNLHFKQETYGVDYHPFEHMAAFCSYGSSGHVIVCSFSKQASGLELGLQFSLKQNDTISVSKSEPNVLSDLKTKKKKKKVNGGENSVIPSRTEDIMDSQTNISWNSESLLASSCLSVNKPPDVPKLNLAKIIDKMDEVLSVSSSRSIHTVVSETNVSQTSSTRSAARQRRDRRKHAKSRSGS
ncbi:jouberin [Anabrus simplex]|uniref:jouberin n=1 Tax=Anabrus simplex TaxID=316456 RepID=UPI0035A2A9A3